MLFVLHQSKNEVAGSKTSAHTNRSYYWPHLVSNLKNDTSPDTHINLRQPNGNEQTIQRTMQSNDASGFDLSKIAIQPKLKISQPSDEYEQEADKVAEQLMRMAVPSDLKTLGAAAKDDQCINRRCASCEIGEKEEEEKELKASRKPMTTSNLEASDRGTIQINNIGASDSFSLDTNTKEFMGTRFGYDFSKVRIHADKEAARSANSINALAYTVGNDIVFGEGQYAPNTQQGRRILAHELTHVIQQKHAPHDVIQRQQPCTPPTNSPYVGMSSALKDMICSSFNERLVGAPNSDENLANAWWNVSSPPTTPWQALDNIGPAGVQLLVEIHQRVGSTIPSIWPLIHNIRKLWSTTSRGFSFNVHNYAAFKSALNDRSVPYCKDTPFMESGHQGTTLTHCWREKVSGGHGLHICLDAGNAANAINTIHIDLHQIVRGEDQQGFCKYSPSLIVHGVEVYGKLYKHSIFERYEESRSLSKSLRSRFSHAAPTLNRIDERLAIVGKYLMEQAVRGAAGEMNAELEIRQVIEDIYRELDYIANPLRYEGHPKHESPP